jgi:four helix bundle protein
VDKPLYQLEEFELYSLARRFRRGVYVVVRQLPKEERFALDPQLRRAAISVSNNIAEGHGRWHFQENIQFCRIARGSVEEVIDDLNVCLDEGYGDAAAVAELKAEAYQLINRINGYIAYLAKSRQGASSGDRVREEYCVSYDAVPVEDEG